MAELEAELRRQAQAEQAQQQAYARTLAGAGVPAEGEGDGDGVGAGGADSVRMQLVMAVKQLQLSQAEARRLAGEYEGAAVAAREATDGCAGAGRELKRLQAAHTVQVGGSPTTTALYCTGCARARCRWEALSDCTVTTLTTLTARQHMTSPP